MKRILLIIFVLAITINVRAQEPIRHLKFEYNVDSLDLWTYELEIPLRPTKRKSDAFSSLKEAVPYTWEKEIIGQITIFRKEPIIDIPNKDTLWPSIRYYIFPVSELDSIVKFEGNRTKALSCCYPICGAYFQICKEFIFWSDPWANTVAFRCNGKDYVRKNADRIFKVVKKESFTSIEGLINNLPIVKNKN